MSFEVAHELADIAERARGLLDAEFFRQRDYVDQCLTRGGWPASLLKRGSGGERRKPELVPAILEELVVLLCTDDRRYLDVRKKGADFSRVVLPVVAGYVAGTVGVPLAVATGAVAFIAISVLRVGQGVFCRVATHGAARRRPGATKKKAH